MSAFWTLYKRELQAIFLSPIAYVCAVVVEWSLGFMFLYLLGTLVTSMAEFNLQELVDLFFGRFILLWPLLIVLTTVITMRLFAEEKRTGTVETLLTAPVTDLQVVLAKYLGALSFYLLLWAPTVLFFGALGRKGLDPGLLAGAYLGVTLVGGLYIAVGCLVSSLCVSQIVAAILSFILLSVATFGPIMILSNPSMDLPWLKDALAYLNLFPAWNHSLTGDLNRGLVSIAHLVYPLSAIACCLFLTCKVMESRSWK